MKINYILKDKIDSFVVASALSLILLGLIAIFSSTFNNPISQDNFQKQFYFFLFSIIVFFIILFLPTNIFKLISIPTYIFGIILLIFVLIFGKTVSGAKSWISIGGFGLQPSEFMKIATVLMIANFLSRTNNDIDSIKDIIISILIGIIPVTLILLEPDMGSALVYLFFILMLLFVKGISIFWLVVVISPALVAFSAIFGTIVFIITIFVFVVIIFLFSRDLFLNGAVFAFNLASGLLAEHLFNLLSPHQQARIKSFLDPSSDPLGTGYNSIQAMIAVGSGGFFGKGFLAGTQTQLQYIPEQWTDFVFCAISEEFGFIGSSIVIILFMVLLSRILRNALNTKDEFLSLIQVGFFSILFIHFTINVGMVIGLIPIIGIPLPFVSYGGSSLLANVIMIAIISNIYRTRKNYT